MGKERKGKGREREALGRGECAPLSSGKTASPEILNDTSKETSKDTSSTASGDENATRAPCPLQAAGSFKKNQGKVLPDDLKIGTERPSPYPSPARGEGKKDREAGRPALNLGFQREGAPAAGGRYADLSGKAEFKPARNAKQLAVRGTGGQLLSRPFQQGHGLSPDNRRARRRVKEAGEAGRFFNPGNPRAAPVAPKAPCANDANGSGKKGKYDDIAEKI